MEGVVRKQGEAPLRTVGLNQKEDSGIPALALRINGSKSPVRTATGATACQECAVAHLLCQHFTRIMNRPLIDLISLSAGIVAERAGQIRFATACCPRQQQVLFKVQPVSLAE